MKVRNNLTEGMTYASPSIKVVKLHPRSSMLQATSPVGGIQNISGDNVQNDSSNWL